jgi:hypothetical protein
MAAQSWVPSLSLSLKDHCRWLVRRKIPTPKKRIDAGRRMEILQGLKIQVNLNLLMGHKSVVPARLLILVGAQELVLVALRMWLLKEVNWHPLLVLWVVPRT